jgi:hypothetical protein
MSAPSLRSLLLEHLRKLPDGTRICMRCPATGSQKTIFAAGSRQNVHAVSASALLSFAKLPKALSQDEAQDFIVSFGKEYLSFYDGAMDAEELEGRLLVQLSDFYGRTGLFVSLNAKIQLMTPVVDDGMLDPRKVWRLFPNIELARIAVAILSIPASEASVERTFSLQGAVHSKQRNRLDDSTVESEMFLRFNSKSSSGETTEMNDDFDAESHAEAFTMWAEAVSMLDEPQPMEIDEPAPARAPAPAAPAAAAPAIPLRTASMVSSRNHKFIEEWIEEEKVTLRFNWDKHARMRLENQAWDRNRGGWSTKTLEEKIKEEVERRALGEMQA